MKQVRHLLEKANLRPTRQRLALGDLLFTGQDRHVTAEALHEEAVAKNMAVSLATVYNTLHQFTEAGLLRQIAVNGSKAFFDTNTSNHYHFYSERDGHITDIPNDEIEVVGLPTAPEGMEISRVDVIVRLAKKS
ncbi:MAG: iron response transcriptional regulator IrrA [Pseudomonadota bacterium]